MRKLIALCSFVFLLCSCAGVNVKKPDVDNVKKLAILSVVGSEEYKDIETVKGEKENLLTVVGNIIKDNVEMFTEGQVTVVTHGANALFQVLNGIEGWSVIPFEQVIDNEDVNKFFEAGDIWGKVEQVAERLAPENGVRYVMPKGMHELQYSKVNPDGVHYVNGEREEAPVLRGIGKLCESLGVDAIAVAEFNFFYETGMMTTLTSNVTPIVYVDVAIIDKNGEKVLYTDRGWKQFEGSESARINHNYVDMHTDKSVAAYKNAVDVAMEGFRKEAVKKLGK